MSPHNQDPAKIEILFDDKLDVLLSENEKKRPVEWELLTPMWWAVLIEGACRHLKEGTRDDGWIINKLLERSPLMGQDAIPFRQM